MGATWPEGLHPRASSPGSFVTGNYVQFLPDAFIRGFRQGLRPHRLADCRILGASDSDSVVVRQATDLEALGTAKARELVAGHKGIEGIDQ
jgi:hypothetical protein